MEFEDHEDECEEEEPPSYDSASLKRNKSSCRYRECLKNHAVGLGGHAVDGCGEFMAAGAEGTLDALKCAACNCHRNFHRKEDASMLHQQFYRTPAGYLHVRPLALPSTSGGGREEQEEGVSNPSGGGGSSRKRFRTKFTAEQKEKMLELAEKVGWRFQKHDEEVVQQFCDETGVKRHVLKVWMHNNKHTLDSSLGIETMSDEEKKIRGELEAEIEKDLEEEIKDGIYHLALRLHRLYRHRKSADQTAGSRTISELSINIKMEGETKIEIKETKREARPRLYGRSVSSTAAPPSPSYQYTNWAKTLRSGTSATVPAMHKRNDGSYKAKVMSSGRDSPRKR